jgi:hypothetical protein
MSKKVEKWHVLSAKLLSYILKDKTSYFILNKNSRRYTFMCQTTRPVTFYVTLLWLCEVIFHLNDFRNKTFILASSKIFEMSESILSVYFLDGPRRLLRVWISTSVHRNSFQKQPGDKKSVVRRGASAAKEYDIGLTQKVFWIMNFWKIYCFWIW